MKQAERAFGALQSLLPTRLLSRCMHALAGARQPWLKRLLIAGFRRLYFVDMQESDRIDADSYLSFNDFFTRSLREGARPLAPDPRAIASPIDGQLGSQGTIDNGQLFQTKGMAYDAEALLGSPSTATLFGGGLFATLYLAPENYHRVHMPMAGCLRQTHYVPGRLFGVNPASVRSIPRLFTRNERLVCLFDTVAGPMALVLVGAFCVGGIATVWSGTVTPPHWRQSRAASFPAAGRGSVRLARGTEMGRFNLGSTVILLFAPGAVQGLPQAAANNAVRVGQTLATLAD